MDKLTPNEFYERVGVRVPDSVIRNLEERKGAQAGEWWLGPYIPITGEIVEDMCIQEQLDLLGVVGRE